MALIPGTRLGPYEVLSLLGAGGMGEVYRARDTNLNRDVALKILPDAFARDADRLARFTREAQTLASLNHPNIAAIHGVEESPDGRALVMELVNGEDLSAHIARGRMPLAHALAIARQIADALEAAHEQGVVHRDLKPANVKVRDDGTVKVLDFGLAKASAGAGFAGAPATTIDGTLPGAIIGTAPYMSPEQARGRVVDKRTDIWAFGCVLFEMVTGRRAFPGETLPDTIAAVMHSDPDWRALPAETPAGLIRLLRRCLDKDPVRRVHDIADARIEIDDLRAASPGPDADVLPPARAPRRAPALAILAAGLTVGVVIGVVAVRWWPRHTAAPLVAGRFSIAEPPGESLYLFVDPVKLSPDGRRVVMVTQNAEGRSLMWVRPFDSTTAQAIPETEGATFPFWSPDSRSVGFMAQGQVKAIDLASRSIKTVARIAEGGRGGGTWNHEGVIVFVDASEGVLKRVSADGGEVRAATTLDAARHEQFHAAPQFLPDGRHFLFFARSKQPGESGLRVGELDSTSTTRLLATEGPALYASPGYLLYLRSGRLLAHAFDAERLRVAGDPVPVAERLWANGDVVIMSASDTGALAYMLSRNPATQITSVDRNGKVLTSVGEPGEWVHLAVSPDERQVAAERLDSRTGTGAIFLLDLVRHSVSRLTTDSSWNLIPVWSPDGTRMAFASTRVGASDLFVRNTDGSGEDELLLRTQTLKYPTDWSPDGRTLVYSDLSAPAASDVWALPLTGDRKPAPLLKGPVNETSGRLSPDGRSLLYSSNESGRMEVYVRPLAGPGRRQVSVNGGAKALWRRDGREIYFVSADNKLMAAAIGGRGPFSAGLPEPLFDLTVPPDPWRMPYAAVDSGKRFLVTRLVSRDTSPPVTIVVNWTALLPH